MLTEEQVRDRFQDRLDDYYQTTLDLETKPHADLSEIADVMHDQEMQVAQLTALGDVIEMPRESVEHLLNDIKKLCRDHHSTTVIMNHYKHSSIWVLAGEKTPLPPIPAFLLSESASEKEPEHHGL